MEADASDQPQRETKKHSQFRPTRGENPLDLRPISKKTKAEAAADRSRIMSGADQGEHLLSRDDV